MLICLYWVTVLFTYNLFPYTNCFEKRFCGSKKINIFFLQAMIRCSLRTAFTSALNTKCLKIYCIILVIMIMTTILMRNRNSSSNSAPNNTRNCLSKNTRNTKCPEKFVEISGICHSKSLIKLLFHPLDSFRSAPTFIGTFTWLK